MGAYDSLNRYTQAALLQTALDAARDDVDKREGSVMYDALAPLAFLAGRLIEVFRRVAENADIQTAQGEALDWAASQFGVHRHEASASVREAQATPAYIEFSEGEEFRTDEGLGLVWVCTENPGNGKIVLQCRTEGAAGGADYGQVTPQEPKEGLQSLVFCGTRNEGRDAEKDKAFRIRFWRMLQRNSYGGNFADYQEWIFSKFATQPNGAEFSGAALFPAWNGGGTVKIVPYVQSESSPLDAPTPETLSALKAFLDPEPEDGKGAGVAPIGHRVSVEAPTFEEWSVAAEVRTKAGVTQITSGEAAETAAEVKAAVEAEMLRCVTGAESEYPTPETYTFEFTRAMFINAIMGDNVQPRFADVVSVKVNGQEFTGARHVQTSAVHVMPKMAEFTITRSETP